jgi:hypothetical protein
MMDGTSEENSQQSLPRLRPRQSNVDRPKSPEIPAKVTKRDHRIKESKELKLGTDMELSEDESAPRMKDTVLEEQDKAERVKIMLAYGARAETKGEGDATAVEYFMCDSGGVKSPTQHSKETYKIEMPFGTQELVPFLSNMLSKLPIPVVLDLEKKHFLARPSPEAVFLDSSTAALRYHKLELVEPEWSSHGSVVSVCVFDKVGQRSPSHTYLIPKLTTPSSTYLTVLTIGH